MSSNIKKYSSPKREKGERFSILTMSWWFDHPNFNHRGNLEDFFKVLQKYLPEAMPQRYGSYEPPQFKYEETGLDHLIDFLMTEESIVMYTTKPVFGISIALNKASGFVQHGNKRKYKSSHISISIDADVLNHPNWQEHLPEMWRALSSVIQPFYGDVRVLKNNLSSKTTYWIDGLTELHPVKSWWWRGIPQGSSVAMVIGQPYIELLPELKAAAQKKNGLLILSSDKWDVYSNVVSGAPKNMEPPEDNNRSLAAIFPFKDNGE